MAKYTELCEQILANVGGKDNVTSAVHCMTRLRVNVKDKSKVDVDACKHLKGAVGAQFSGDQFQIIIGQHVSDVYPEFCAVAGLGAQAAIDENLDAVKEPFDIKKVPSKVLDYVSGSIAPILTIMMGAGFFKMFYSILGPSLLGIFTEDSDIIQTLYMVGNAGTYFMPIFLAWGAAKKMNTSIAMALMLGVLLMDPNYEAIVAAGESFSIYGLFPMALNSYSSSVIPILLSVWILKYVHDFMQKHIPNSIKVIGVPFCTLLIMVPLMFCVLAPIGNWISMGLSSAITFIYDLAGPLAIALIGAFWPFIVATGMHGAIVQIALLNITAFGYDPIVLAGSNIANYALMGMVVSYFIRSKGEEKQMASANCITLLVGGISEPSLFGILLRNKKAMVSQIVGGFVGGLVGGILAVKVYVFATSNILTVLAYAGGDGNNFIYACIACAVAFAVSLAVGLVIGYDTNDEGAGLKNYKPRPKKAKAA